MTRPCQAIVVTTEDKNDAPESGEIVSGRSLDPAQSTESRRYGQGPGRPPSKKQRILAWLADRHWDCVTEARAEELALAFPDCSDDTRRAALLESGTPLAVCGHRPVLPTMLACFGVSNRTLRPGTTLVVHLGPAGETLAVEHHEPKA